MNVKENFTYHIVAPTSVGVRITPAGRQPVSAGNVFHMQATSAESNVLSVAAALGCRTKLLTTFVSGSEIALYIKGELRKRNIEFEGKDVPQGGPWGYRHQINIADSGYGLRGPKVLNDRAGEVGRTLNMNDFDPGRLFETEGVAILHLSGLIAALSEATSAFCLGLAKAAKKSGTIVSFDINYRASFWAGRENELRRTFGEIASLADILIGNEEDFQLALGIEGPDAGGKGIDEKIAEYKEMIARTRTLYPNVSMFAATLREVITANTHRWGAVMFDGDAWQMIGLRDIDVYDRIGGGDGFVGGLLYGILKGWQPERCLGFAWASGAMAATLETDYALPVNEDQVWSILAGNARVSR